MRGPSLLGRVALEGRAVLGDLRGPEPHPDARRPPPAHPGEGEEGHDDAGARAGAEDQRLPPGRRPRALGLLGVLAELRAARRRRPADAAEQPADGVLRQPHQRVVVPQLDAVDVHLQQGGEREEGHQVVGEDRDAHLQGEVPHGRDVADGAEAERDGVRQRRHRDGRAGVRDDLAHDGGGVQVLPLRAHDVLQVVGDDEVVVDPQAEGEEGHGNPNALPRANKFVGRFTILARRFDREAFVTDFLVLLFRHILR